MERLLEGKTAVIRWKVGAGAADAAGLVVVGAGRLTPTRVGMGAAAVAVDGQVGNGTQRSRSNASRNRRAQGQRVGRCRYHRRAERVSRPGRSR
jgi:hypothetical protein